MDSHLAPTFELLSSLSATLTNPVANPRRAPTHFDQKLEQTCDNPRRNVLLDTGFQAWFAYFLADAQTQAAFDQLPDSVGREVAHYICSVKPHSTVQELFQHILYDAFRNRERRSKDQISVGVTIIQLHC